MFVLAVGRASAEKCTLSHYLIIKEEKELLFVDVLWRCEEAFAAAIVRTRQSCDFLSVSLAVSSLAEDTHRDTFYFVRTGHRPAAARRQNQVPLKCDDLRLLGARRRGRGF